jgi:hypothetical protein
VAEPVLRTLGMMGPGARHISVSEATSWPDLNPLVLSRSGADTLVTPPHSISPTAEPQSRSIAGAELNTRCCVGKIVRVGGARVSPHTSPISVHPVS